MDPIKDLQLVCLHVQNISLSFKLGSYKFVFTVKLQKKELCYCDQKCVSKMIFWLHTALSVVQVLFF